MLSSWAESTLEVYSRNLRHLVTAQRVAKDRQPLAVLQSYPLSKALANQTPSNMRQIVSACKLCEELELLQEFVP